MILQDFRLKLGIYILECDLKHVRKLEIIGNYIEFEVHKFSCLVEIVISDSNK